MSRGLWTEPIFGTAWQKFCINNRKILCGDLMDKNKN